ncbi:helix-turn-helix transcriptional regulator [Paenibacillus apiarius]|uniref:AraC family transcriptional regulator n=1 Tax=Paenibacillus apiarius TaxID=46240 RepID=A0ABT4DVK9_9BACL|nr:AraC family transcriptional regulator [Paenibacillus apiarius]MCY9513249.1 AraC family transcriptional regulator [Paenibacillus apiarius]MCY9521392.1 AraC family transcriptional regulator [Paenibacillus apiarius]MCY9554462.1 AraC family transcriptional regulator [Paenibacillus apiarius]MCY9560665.1 AraC family transcriptional regulator [Paenibacillus apiarius]MCY9685084.1 AraC family transcriptional regulator [Paenibacillus apiarius]
MRHHFFIDSPERFEETMCRLARQSDGAERTRDRFVRYDIMESWGSGKVEVYRVMDCSALVLYDVAFHNDVVFEYEMTCRYIGVTYCLDGELELQEHGYEKALFTKNSLSVSKSCEMKGCTRHYAGRRYQCVSLTADSEHMSMLFGSSGIDLWNHTMGKLDSSARQQYFTGVQASAEVANIFCSIFHCRLPEQSKILYYEGKVMELMSLLLSVELPGQKGEEAGVLLDDYEIRQIRLGHDRLMESPGNPPTLVQLSRELAISRNKLTKGYKLIYGHTIYVHYRKTCMQNAAELLIDLNKSIQDIALDVGYSNASNFCNAFKREFGLTPLQYRKSKLKRLPAQISTQPT